LLLSPAEAQAIEVHGERRAAVLAPLYRDAVGELHAVFTRRRDDLRSHPGEISFPGGAQDAGEDLRDTALREACEEIGLAREQVTVAGCLPPTPTIVTSFAIYPYVGAIDAGLAWVIQEMEVADVLELRLRDVRDGHGRRRLVRRGVPFKTDTYVVGDHLIWGATARIVRDLLDRAGSLL
jgi:8-oxo-dGTP pyrophosphatase MutT (NUDIX family)